MGDPLLGAGIRAGRIPRRRQIMGQCDQRRAIDLRAKRGGSIMPGDAILEMGDRSSAVFQRVSSSRATSRLVGSTSLVASGGQGGLVTRFLKLPAQRLPDLVVGLHRLIGGLDGSLDRVFGDCLDDLRGDSAVDPDTANTDAQTSRRRDCRHLGNGSDAHGPTAMP